MNDYIIFVIHIYIFDRIGYKFLIYLVLAMSTNIIVLTQFVSVNKISKKPAICNQNLYIIHIRDCRTNEAKGNQFLFTGPFTLSNLGQRFSFYRNTHHLLYMISIRNTMRNSQIRIKFLHISINRTLTSTFFLNNFLNN